MRGRRFQAERAWGAYKPKPEGSSGTLRLAWLGATVSLLTFGGGMRLTSDWRGSGQAVAASFAASASFPCTVASITDGDTFRCAETDAGGRQLRIRLSGVAARETDGTCRAGHPCPEASAEAATAELDRLASG